MKIDSLTIFVNSECNLDCKYCFVDNNNSRLIWSDKIEYIISDLLEQTDNLNLSILWWEPLLNFDFIKKLILTLNIIRDKYKNKIINFSWINSNGTIYSYDIYKFLFDNNINLEFSLDGSLDQWIDRFRVHKYKKDFRLYDVASKNVSRYKEIYWRAPNISIVITKDNVWRLLSIIKHYVEVVWVKSISLSQLIVNKWFIDLESFNLFKKEYISIFKYYIKNVSKYKFQLEPIESVVKWYLSPWFWVSSLLPCTLWKWLYLWVNWNLYACTYLAWNQNKLEKNIFWNLEDGIDFDKFSKYSELLNKKYEESEKETFGDKLDIKKMFCLREWYKKWEALLNEKLFEYSLKLPFTLIAQLWPKLSKETIKYFEDKYWFISRFH